MLRIAVLGAGHGGKAIAADLTLKGHQVTLYNRTYENMLDLVRAGGVRITGVLGDHIVKIHGFESDLERACSEKDVLFVVTPAVGHEFYAKALSRIAQRGQLIILAGHSTLGALYFSSILQRSGCKAGPIAEMNTLTFICRTMQDGTVALYGEPRLLKVSSIPASANDALRDVLEVTYPRATLAENILEIALTNMNAVIHPAGMILSVGHIERTGGDFFFYHETTPGIAAVIECIDRERLAIMKQFGLPAVPFVKHFYDMGYTTENALREGSVLTALVESEPDRWIKAPSSLNHRYIHEDVGFGLVPMTALGMVVGVETPTMDAIITLASAVNGVDYRKSGLSFERLGLEDLTSDQLLSWVETGVRP